MMNRRHFLILSGGVPLLIVTARGQGISPAPRGSVLRKAILDSARPIFQAETNGDIEFVVRRLNLSGDWAFGDVTLQRPGGRAIDWRRTKYAEANATGAFDPAGSFFLARRTGQTWRILAAAVGPTDIAWDGWDKQYGAPRALFDRGI